MNGVYGLLPANGNGGSGRRRVRIAFGMIDSASELLRRSTLVLFRKKLETETEQGPNPQIDAEGLPKDLTDADDWVSVHQVTAPWDEGAC
jgi:hypothetical protein